MAWSVRLARSQMQRSDGQLSFGAPGATWDYSPAVFLLSLWRLGERTGDPAYGRYARAVIDSYLTPEGNIRTYRLEEFSQDQVNPGKIVLALYERTREPVYLRAAQLLRRQLAGQPRNRAGGFWHKARYPDQMWLDGLYMAEPYLAQYGKIFHESADFDEVVKQFHIIAAHTYDPATGLFYHGWDESRRMAWADPATGHAPSFWSRGLGWYAMALVDSLDYFPPEHPGRAELIGLLNRVAAGIARYQDPRSGVWYQVTDQGSRAGNYLEASGSAMFVYAVAKGVNRGYLGPEYVAVARRGFDGLVREFIRENGDGSVSLIRVNQASGLAHPQDGTYAYYLRQPIVPDDPKGVGPFILAGIEVDRLSGSKRPAAAPALRHDVIAIDEGLGNLLRIDEFDPSRNWRVPIGHPHPRDLQLIGQGRILLSHDRGMAVYDLADGHRESDLATYAEVSSARRLANGNTLLASVLPGPAPAMSVVELDPQNRVQATTVYPGHYVRLMRQTARHTFLFGMNDRITEGDGAGNFIWSAAVPGFRHAWKAVRLADGRTLASAGYGAFLVVWDPAGKILRKFGGAAEVPASVHPYFYADFQLLPNGDVVVANWQGHGPGHGQAGQQLLEFDPQGRIVWQWQDGRIASSLQAVLVLDGLNPALLYDERNGIEEPLR